jgi:hypothetical protein
MKAVDPVGLIPDRAARADWPHLFRARAQTAITHAAAMAAAERLRATMLVRYADQPPDLRAARAVLDPTYLEAVEAAQASYAQAELARAAVSAAKAELRERAAQTHQAAQQEHATTLAAIRRLAEDAVSSIRLTLDVVREATADTDR